MCIRDRYSVGDVVTVSSYYASSTETDSNKAVIPSEWKTGTITRIVEGARNPYLLNNGKLGWCNDCLLYTSVHTYYPNTAINNSDSTYIDVRYVADTKLYIDNHSGGAGYQIGYGLKISDGKLTVDTATEVEQDLSLIHI